MTKKKKKKKVFLTTFETLSQCTEFCNSDTLIIWVAAISLAYCDISKAKEELDQNAPTLWLEHPDGAMRN